MARQNQNGEQYADPSQYDFGPEVDDGAPYSAPVQNFAPAQNGNQFGARRAVPPQGPDGRFVRDDRQPRRQPSQHPLQQSYRQQPQQDFDQDFDDGSNGQQSNQVYQHSRALERRAMEVGFTDEEIDSTPSAVLDNLVWTRKGQQAEESRRNAIAQAVQKPPGAQQQTQQPPPPEPDEEISFGEFEEVMDKGFVKSLKGTLQKQLKDLKKVQADLQAERAKNDARDAQVKQQQDLAAYASHMDRLFSKHADYLGDERWTDMQPGDPSHVKREAVIALARRDTSRRSNQEKIDFAVATLFGVDPRLTRRARPQQQQRQQQQQRRDPRQQEWDEAGLQRPTNRRPSPEANGVRRAIANVTQQLQDLDDPGADGQVEYDDFLGGNNNQTYR